MDNEICEHCEKPVGASWINSDGARMHPICYRLKYPFTPRLTFMDVLLNGEDQVIVRELLHHKVPQDVKDEIVILFNKVMSGRHARTVRDYEAGKTI